MKQRWPSSKSVSRRSRAASPSRYRAAALAAIAGCLASACTSTSSSGPPARPSAPSSPTASPSATPTRQLPQARGYAANIRAHGELAVVSRGQLYLLGGPAGKLTHVRLPGTVTAPTWSPDHRWLAVQVSSPGHEFDETPAVLYLLRANGRRVRRLTSMDRDVTDAVWSPTHDVLAVTSSATRHARSPRYRVDLVTRHGVSRRLVRGAYISGTVWAPTGDAIAASSAKFSRHGPERLRWRSRVLVVDIAPASTRVVTSRHGGVLEIAGWTPDGSHVLYWPDPMGSGSIAADGLSLLAVPVGGGQPIHVADSLTHSAWTAYSPNGRSLATVDGGLRDVWGGHKHVIICPTLDTCRRIAQPRGTVSLWPTWTADGTQVVFARLPSQLASPFGHRAVARWTRHGRLFVATPGQSPHPLAGVPRGATAPEYAADGTLLFVTANWVWLKPPGHSAQRVLGPLSDLGRDTYYGYVPYRRTVAWSRARPEGYAGTS